MDRQGDRPTDQAAVGILMLDSRFPRIPGDMGHPASWPFPVLYHVVGGASPDRVVCRDAEGLLPDFIQGARDLIAQGVAGITTTCGFLSLFQRDIAAAVDVPVATSSLMQVSTVNRLLPASKRCGILTISAEALGPAHLAAAGVPDGTPVQGMPRDGAFAGAILGDTPDLDVAAARAEAVAACRRLAADHGDLGAVVLECTNLSPYAAEIRAALGLPVFSMLSFVTWFQSGLAPPRW